MNLVIDIGNSFQKIAIFDNNDQLLSFESHHSINLDIVKNIFQQYPIRHSILSAVSSFDETILDYLKKNSFFIPFSLDLTFPISINYKEKSTLGSDRIANAVAAHSFFPNTNVLSIQIGSCIVADFVDSFSIYHGGSISPGIQMRFRALHQYTSHLPLLIPQNIDYFIGHSTEESILSGVINGIINEINSLIERYKKEFDNLKVILTGGDAFYLQKSIKNAIFANSNLVLMGLHKILKINANAN